MSSENEEIAGELIGDEVNDKGIRRPAWGRSGLIVRISRKLDELTTERDREKRWRQESDREWFGKLEAADAEVARLKEQS